MEIEAGYVPLCILITVEFWYPQDKKHLGKCSLLTNPLGSHCVCAQLKKILVYVPSYIKSTGLVAL